MTDQTDQTDLALPLADTLDEATLRRVFPAAPAQLDVPRDVGSIFKARMKTAGGSRRGVGIAIWGLLVVAGIALLAFGQAPSGIGTIVFAVIIVVGISIWQHSKAADEFFHMYATARGLDYAEDVRVPGEIPLFSKGDKRKWPRVMNGTIAGQGAQLGHYTYTEVSTDSDGNRTETDYDFTVVHFTLPAEVGARFAGVYVAPKSFMSFGGAFDKLTHDRKVELESKAFLDRYSLRVVDSQDDIALYELFSTTFIDHLANDLKIYWEQRGTDLVCWRKGHESEAADLDRFCLESWHVLHRYLEEYR